MPPRYPKNPKRPASSEPLARRPGSPSAQRDPREQYGAFRASLLFCPTCRQATPTRERLLLVLPTGNLYEYLCAQCGTSTGSKTDKNQDDVRLYIP
jgi:hypothetical protein